MKIALCSTFVPFINGGYRNIVEWLQAELTKQGHTTEIVYLPENDSPELLFTQMMAFRWVNLDQADRIICFRPQAHLIPHPVKIVWFIHHLRSFYDLWDSQYRWFPDDFKNRGIRSALHAADTSALREAKAVFSNSNTVAQRLRTFNNIDSEVLYPPIAQPERFRCNEFGDDVLYISRLEHHKRQHLLVEAMRYVKTPVKLRICGVSSSKEYSSELARQIDRFQLSNRVTLNIRWVDETEKIDLLANCLATAYIPKDEDSYGYPTLESSHSSKPILTTNDSGGVLELVQDEVNGLVCEPDPRSLAKAMDRLYLDRKLAREFGRNAAAQVEKHRISWSHVLDRLLA